MLLPAVMDKALSDIDQENLGNKEKDTLLI